MRNKLLLVGVITMALTLSVDAHGQTAKCASIKNHDDRMTCNAVVSGNKSWCTFVKDSQKRVWCFVLLGKK